MPSSPLLQTLIHKLEIGAGSRSLRMVALVLGVVALAFVYDLRAYRNLAAPEAMDAAQLARNLSEGKGYTTEFIRPFSLYLVQAHHAGKTGGAPASADSAQIKSAHPDLANAPVYPFALAMLMKIMPFDYAVNVKGTFWGNNESFWRYQPDFLIAIFNEIFLAVAVVLAFFLAKKLFDTNVAWLSAILILGCELLWRFSASGLSTLLLLVIFLGLTLVLLEIERRSREVPPRSGQLLGLAIFAGFLTGMGALTRYSFGWTIIPVALFLLMFSGPRRIAHLLAALAVFSLVLTPWIIRNAVVSGTPFGTAGYALVEGTVLFPGFQLERAIHPDLTHVLWLTAYTQKLFGNARALLTGDLLKTFGTGAGALFFAGLFLNFRSTGARRLRYFLLMCLGVFIVVQSLGRTQLSEVSPEINSENLLVLLVPLIFIFGAAFFFTLLRQMTLPLPQLRHAVVAGFVAWSCLPLVFALLASTRPVVFPPYFPPKIQEAANYMKSSELMMSDVPWAVAWYGNRQCVWLTLDAQNEFSAVNGLKAVQALYLSPQTMDGKFVSEWMEGNEHGWGNFLYQTLDEKRVPDQFPLTHALDGYFPEQMFLADHDRWSGAQ